MTAKTTVFLKLESRIAADERGGIMHRWRYGRELLAIKGARKQLPHGLTGDLISAAAKAGLKISETEIRRRVRCASVYTSEGKVGRAATDFGSWWNLVEAGFPPVEDDDLEDIDISAPDAWGQPSLIPGLSPEIKVCGVKIPLAEATVGDVQAHRDTYRQIHDNFAKRLALIEFALGAMLDGSDGDLTVNAIEAYQAGMAIVEVAA